MASNLTELRESAWTHIESYHSFMGRVEKLASGDWRAFVNLPGERTGRIAETYVSADVAKAAVKRNWEKYNKKG